MLKWILKYFGIKRESKSKKRWSPEDLDKLQGMMSYNMTLKFMAVKLGRTESAVYQKINKIKEKNDISKCETQQV